MFDKNSDEIYLIKDFLQNENILSCGDYRSDTLNKSVKIPVTNLSKDLLKLTKVRGQQKSSLQNVQQNKPTEINSICSNNFDIKEIDLKVH